MNNVLTSLLLFQSEPGGSDLIHWRPGTGRDLAQFRSTKYISQFQENLLRHTYKISWIIERKRGSGFRRIFTVSFDRLF